MRYFTLFILSFQNPVYVLLLTAHLKLQVLRAHMWLGDTVFRLKSSLDETVNKWTITNRAKNRGDSCSDGEGRGGLCEQWQSWFLKDEQSKGMSVPGQRGQCAGRPVEGGSLAPQGPPVGDQPHHLQELWPGVWAEARPQRVPTASCPSWSCPLGSSTHCPRNLQWIPLEA